MPGMTVFVYKHLTCTLFFDKSPVVPIVVNFTCAHRLVDSVLTRLVSCIPIDIVITPRHVNVQNSIV